MSDPSRTPPQGRGAPRGRGRGRGGRGRVVRGRGAPPPKPAASLPPTDTSIVLTPQPAGASATGATASVDDDSSNSAPQRQQQSTSAARASPDRAGKPSPRVPPRRGSPIVRLRAADRPASMASMSKLPPPPDASEAARSESPGRFAAAPQAMSEIPSRASAPSISRKDTATALAGEKKKEKERRMLEQRKLVHQEVVESEKGYVASLEELVQGLYNPLQQQSLLDAASLSAVFSNLPQLLAVNQEFLKNLEKSLAGSLSLGDAFLQISDYLRSYSYYCNRHAEGIAWLASAVKKSKELSQFVNQYSTRGIVAIQDLLITPVQRICKYPLLLKELVRHTPTDHEDFAKLASALGKISSIAQEINDKKRENDEGKVLIEIEKSLTNTEGFVVVSPSRKLLKRGYVKKHGKGSSTKVHLILFDDFLLITNPKLGGKYELKTAISLSEALASDGGTLKQKHAFEVINVKTGKKYVFAASNPAEYNAWLGELTSIIDAHLEKGVKERKKASEYSSSPLRPTERRPLPAIPHPDHPLHYTRFQCIGWDMRLVELPKDNIRVRAITFQPGAQVTTNDETGQYEDLVFKIKKKFGLGSISLAYPSPSAGANVSIVSQGELDRCLREGVRELSVTEERS